MGLRRLTDQEARTLGSVTIVGMRFYSGALDYIYNVGTNARTPFEDKCLFLVPEVDNSHDINAVMLHNGKQKLGSVSAEQSPILRRILTEWKNEARRAGKPGLSVDDVIVCDLSLPIHSSRDDFKYQGSITVRGKFRVNERLARKYSDITRKEK